MAPLVSLTRPVDLLTSDNCQPYAPHTAHGAHKDGSPFPSRPPFRYHILIYFHSFRRGDVDIGNVIIHHNRLLYAYVDCGVFDTR